MTPGRADTLRGMLARRPEDARLRFGLAIELLTSGELEEGADELRRYLGSSDDEGNAWGRLGSALVELGRLDEAAEAYATGVLAAERHGHPTMADEFRECLANLKRDP